MIRPSRPTPLPEKVSIAGFGCEQAHTMTAQRGLDYNAGPRDQIVSPVTGVAGRLERALKNFLETFALFAASILIAHVVMVHNGLTLAGAWLYFIGRVLYRLWTVRNVTAAPGPPPSFQSPLTFLLFGLIAGYYIVYYAGLFVHIRDDK